MGRNDDALGVLYLEEVIEWIDNWHPNFEEDAEWIEFRELIDSYLKEYNKETE